MTPTSRTMTRWACVLLGVQGPFLVARFDSSGRKRFAAGSVGDPSFVFA